MNTVTQEKIVSRNNPLVKKMAQLLQKKYRQETGYFLVEGLRTVEEAVEAGLVQSLFYVPADGMRLQNLLYKAVASGIQIYEINSHILAKISDTTTPQGIVACTRQHTASLMDMSEVVAGATGPLVVVDRLQDPGNLGTILRTADAVGAAGIIILAGTADIFSSKVVRSSMGSLFHVPVCGPITEEELINWCPKQGVRLAATTLENSCSIYQADLTGKLALIIGNEANGVSEHLLQQASLKLHIPMPGKAESLNAAMAAGIILFEILRQRICS